MSKRSDALYELPPTSVRSLQRLGANLAIARLRRRESRATWATRLKVSIPTVIRLEAGEPTVAIGIYATALWLLGRDASLAELAAPESDAGAVDLDIRKAVEIRDKRARASARAWEKRQVASESKAT